MNSSEIPIKAFTPQERIELWTSFCSMARVKELILVDIQDALDKKNTLDGCTPENVSQRQGVVQGINIALSILKRKPSDL